MKSTESLPFVSILLPIRNEADFIQRSLEAVLSQEYPPDCMELLVADGISTDGTREIVTGLANKYPDVSLKILDNPGRIVSTGLNILLRQVRGEIILRVDGHCEIAPDYVRRCVLHLLNDNVDGVGGSMETIGETPLAKVIAIAMSSTFGVGDSAFRTVVGRTMLADSVPFPAYTRAIMEYAGLYDEELVRNQDDEYNYRLRKLGAKILLAADVTSRYYSRSSLRSLWRQYYQYGFFKVRVLQKHPLQMRPRQFVPFFFVVALLTTLSLSIFSLLGFWVFAFILTSYLLANLTASIWIANRNGWQYLSRLPLIFAILHCSYGFGFLVGLIHFANRWKDHKGKVPQFVRE